MEIVAIIVALIDVNEQDRLDSFIQAHTGSAAHPLRQAPSTSTKAPVGSDMPKQSPQEYLVAGGVAGVVSRTCIAPIERVKILYQIASKASGLHWTAIAPRILREEGPLAFWKGNTAAVVRVMPCASHEHLLEPRCCARGGQKNAADRASRRAAPL